MYTPSVNVDVRVEKFIDIILTIWVLFHFRKLYGLAIAAYKIIKKCYAFPGKLNNWSVPAKTNICCTRKYNTFIRV